MERGHVPQISDLELFADCTKSELRQIGSLTTLLYRPKDQVLIREGAAAEEFIVVASGQARVTRQTPDGVTKVADVGSGEPLGVVPVSGGPWTATATALTDLAIFVSSPSEFRAILDVAPSVERKLRRKVGHEVAELSVAA